jgi:hypothetical protein
MWTPGDGPEVRIDFERPEPLSANAKPSSDPTLTTYDSRGDEG